MQMRIVQRNRTVQRLTIATFAAAFTIVAASLANSGAAAEKTAEEDLNASNQSVDPTQGKAEKKNSKIITDFPKAFQGFQGRLMGTISAINKKGIVLSGVMSVEKDYPPEQPGDLPFTKAVEKDAPETWLLNKNVQLLCDDNEYKKNYRVGDVIRGVVKWSDKDKSLLITGFQGTRGVGVPPHR